MNKNHYKANSGLAIITLLVVCLILMITTCIGIYYLHEKYSRDRDNQRIRDFEMLAQALEQYYQAHGYYPAGEGFSTDPEWGSVNYQIKGNPLAVLVSEGFLAKLPIDPINEPTGCLCQGGYRLYYCNYQPDSGQGCLRSADSPAAYESAQYHLSVCLETSSAACQKACGGTHSPVGNYCATDTLR